MPSSSAGNPAAAAVAPGSEQTSRSSTPAASIASTAGPEESDSSKLRTFIGILKKFVGVADIAAVRFSLPAQLMEPIPNLEYWHYLDRPETFASIGDSEDPLERMLACLRFWFTKDLKYVKGKPCKPYNSTLGEFFRCQWEIEDPSGTAKPSAESAGEHKLKVSYITEQTSHHPPVSAYYAECPEKGISARGFDQISAKFTGTSIRVVPGVHNEGIYVTLQKRDNETYHLTHPAAYLGGFLRGSLNVTVADTCYIACKKTGLRVILHYLEEGWLGKTQNKVEGVIYRCDVEKDKTARIKDVSDKDVVGRIEGAWTDKIYFSKGSAAFSKSTDKTLLMDLNPLFPVQKIVPPLDEQLENESRKYWANVTDAIMSKQYSKATAEKQTIEERQRKKAADRKARNVDWTPRFFTGATTPVGIPELTEEGRLAIEKLNQGDFHLTPAAVTGA
ncbi:hypothetical protein AAFC00_005881 [Neodothiora populina]|uniref:Oxysterol-binding protein n=1 Tax=Neodothiora populina TaxID=2781224 RepID=A0ABR3P663_9PEZI